MGIREYKIGKTCHLLAHHPDDHGPSVVDKRLISTAPSLRGITQYFYLLFLSYRRRSSALLADNYGPIGYLYLWQRGSAVASCRARIKSRIRFRGEGESDVGSPRPGIYGRLLVASLLRRGARHNLRYKKIDVVDSPTIHAAFVIALVVAFHRKNMEILFSFPWNSRTKGLEKRLKSRFRKRNCR